MDVDRTGIMVGLVIAYTAVLELDAASSADKQLEPSNHVRLNPAPPSITVSTCRYGEGEGEGEDEGEGEGQHCQLLQGPALPLPQFA